MCCYLFHLLIFKLLVKVGVAIFAFNTNRHYPELVTVVVTSPLYVGFSVWLLLCCGTTVEKSSPSTDNI